MPIILESNFKMQNMLIEIQLSSIVCFIHSRGREIPPPCKKVGNHNKNTTYTYLATNNLKSHFIITQFTGGLKICNKCLHTTHLTFPILILSDNNSFLKKKLILS